MLNDGESRKQFGSPVIRQAVMGDAEAIFDAHRDSVLNLCAGAYTEAQLRVWFEGRSPTIYQAALEAGRIWLAESAASAETAGRVLGFVGAVPGEVTLLFVRPEAAGHGLGARLLALGVSSARAGFDGALTVVATSNSRRFYERHGFAFVEPQFFVRGALDTRFEVLKMQQRGVDPL